MQRGAALPLTAMSFRIVWDSGFGKVSSRPIGDLERARLIADSLALHMKAVIQVADAESKEIVYSTSPTPKTRPAKPRRGSRKKRPPSSG